LIRFTYIIIFCNPDKVSIPAFESLALIENKY